MAPVAGIRRALKSAVKLPIKLTRGGGSNNTPTNEEAIVVLRVQIVGCTDLTGRDKSGLSDPYVC
jgi:phosphatidylserine decarboxylase